MNPRIKLGDNFEVKTIFNWEINDFIDFHELALSLRIMIEWEFYNMQT